MLERASNQTAQMFRSVGVKPGDVIMLFLDNSPRYLEIVWAAHRAGCRFSCISSKLLVDEVQCEWRVNRLRERYGTDGFTRWVFSCTPLETTKPVLHST